MATVLMYLTDVEEGGETVFPHVPKAAHQTLENGWTNCSLQVTVMCYKAAGVAVHQGTQVVPAIPEPTASPSREVCWRLHTVLAAGGSGR
jgi:hypothetical protein